MPRYTNLGKRYGKQLNVYRTLNPPFLMGSCSKSNRPNCCLVEGSVPTRRQMLLLSMAKTWPEAVSGSCHEPDDEHAAISSRQTTSA